MQDCETFLNKKWQTVMWHREWAEHICTATTWAGSSGKSLGPGLIKPFLSNPRPKPRPQVPRPRPLWGVLEAKARPWGQQDCP